MANHSLDKVPTPTNGRQRFFGWDKSSRDTIQAYLFLFPFLIVYVIFVIFPVLQASDLYELF